MEKEIKTLNDAIKQAEDIAKNGTKKEKEYFVDWATMALTWLSFQGDIEGLSSVSAQYKAYLKALSNEV